MWFWFDGSSGGDGVTVTWDSLTGVGNTTIASNTTTDIGASPTPGVIISGTTTITGLGTVAAGTLRIVEFSGALTLTHNATSLILPGGVDINKTAANDTAIFQSLGSGNWRCIAYKKQTGKSVIPPAASDITGTLAAASGGTGQSSYAVGDLLYADTTTTLAKLADAATGNALISGGVGVAPSYGKISLTTAASGTLQAAQMLALTGDVTNSAGAVATTIANNAITTAKIADTNVTYAKIQNVSATDKLLGRSTAGAGVVEEVPCTATGRSLIACADAAAVRAAIGFDATVNALIATAIINQFGYPAIVGPVTFDLATGTEVQIGLTPNNGKQFIPDTLIILVSASASPGSLGSSTLSVGFTGNTTAWQFSFDEATLDAVNECYRYRYQVTATAIPSAPPNTAILISGSPLLSGGESWHVQLTGHCMA